MNHSLDTHTFLWWASDSAKLGGQAFKVLMQRPTLIYVSVAVQWELVIKVQIGKLKLEDEPSQFFNEQCAQHGFIVLPILTHHVAEVMALPLIHRDPFDRILIAQARNENLTLITGDPLIQRYEVTTLW